MFTMIALLPQLALGAAVHAPRQDTTYLPPKYKSISVGSIKPTGWLLDQTNIQVNGLFGHLPDFYPTVQDSKWTGGGTDYSDLNEGGSYFYNTAVPQAFISDNSALKTWVSNFANYVIAHQANDGWLGPEPKTFWGRYPFLLGLTQHMEADPSLVNIALPAVYKFISLMNTMLKNNGQGLEEWGAARAAEMALTFHWLRDNYPSVNGVDQTSLLIETEELIWSTALNWNDYLNDATIPHGPSPAFNMTTHGVNVAMALKMNAVRYRTTGSQEQIDTSYSNWNSVFKYHGLTAGHFAADEHLAGLDPWRGAELCEVAELLFSSSQLYQTFGDNLFADKAEMLAYNSFPATVTPDIWGRQYLQQTNQIYAKRLNPNPFASDGDYSNVFGTEPNYPCCTVNGGQTLPKFITNSFVTSWDKTSLIHAYLAPLQLSTTLANGNAVSVKVTTQYPFSDILQYDINAEAGFDFFIRIPTWANAQSTIALNGGASAALSPDSGKLQKVQVPAGTSSFVLTLGADIVVENKQRNTVAVKRGPLAYATDLWRSERILATYPNEGRAVDREYDLTVSWAFGIDPSTLEFVPNPSPEPSGTLPSPIWDTAQHGGGPPIKITANGCRITNWPNNGDIVTAAPESPQCDGSVQIVLWPYGSAKLRLSELPTVTP
ncbi:hypothetical protein BT69DRAFT_1348679 [Atractiella rhizophila]|nr:hypothetical protein BT69DRAFT_1348679 [Atractiella rhizophila]